MKTEYENAQASTLRQEISTVITKFKKHTYEQMTFDTKPAITHWRYSRNLPWSIIEKETRFKTFLSTQYNGHTEGVAQVCLLIQR